jgi:hypothetical protein
MGIGIGVSPGKLVDSPRWVMFVTKFPKNVKFKDRTGKVCGKLSD